MFRLSDLPPVPPPSYGRAWSAPCPSPKTLEPVYTIRVESVKTGLKWTGRLDHDGGVVEKVPGKAAGFIKTTAPGSFNLT